MAIIGIDLGTTNSLCAAWQNGKSVLIPNALGKILTPSVVSIDDNGTVITGEIAKQRLVSHPGKTASVFKQWMGTSKTFSLDEKEFTPEDLSSFILRSLKNDAEAFLKETITEAIISVPAYFNDRQRTATRTAGMLAGLKVDRILNEPSAAALAYRQHGIHDGTSVVFDFGGGTLDVSVLDSFGNIVDILAVAGDNHLGGSDIDKAIVSAFFEEHTELGKLWEDEKLPKEQFNMLIKTAENCKMALTDNPQVFMIFSHNGKEYKMMLNNEKLTDICSPTLLKFNNAVKRALQNAEKTLPRIDNFILVGGSCRMPIVKEYLQTITQKPPLFEVDPDLAVVSGLGVAAGIKERDENIRDMVLMDICPFSLGVSVRKGELNNRFSPIIPRNSALPTSRVEHYSTIADFQTEIYFRIYQGESLEASQNLLLGECEIPVPPLPAGEAAVKVRFTYDINGILDIEFHVWQSGEKFQKLIISDNQLTEEELQKRLDALSKLKLNPRELEENKLLIARGQRLYEEYTGPFQQRIENSLLEFEHALLHGHSLQIAKLYEKTSIYFDHLDLLLNNLLFTGEIDYQDEYEE
ncbi:MAG: Hsp70 family protein [Treponema sp.]|jgi:molecular chaperone HscC|nr:Hsp70 family protein [Treponema sp.]